MSVKERVDNISRNNNLNINTPYTAAKIEVSGICTLQCNFCYNKIMRQNNIRQKIMAPKDFQFVLDSLRQIETIKEVGLFYMGESALCFYLKKYYQKLKDLGYFTFLTTNGTLYRAIVEAIPYIDSLKVSWNYKDIHDFHEKTGFFDEQYNAIKENIKRFYRECHKYHKKLTISTVLDSNRQDYDNSLKELIYDDHYWIPLQTQGGTYNNGLDGVVGEDDNKVSPMPCWSLFKGIYIDVDLNVRACCYGHTKEHILGNLKEKPLIEIMSNKKLLQIKKQQLNGEIPDMCKVCLSNQRKDF